MKKITYVLFCAATVLLGLQSCLDFDIPGDELSGTDEIIEDVIYYGKADKIDYKKEISKEGFLEARNELKNMFGQMQSAQYSMRGGKESHTPAAHAYQYQFSLTTDNYSGYFVLPHNFDGRMKSTYYNSQSFCSGPNGSFILVKNNLVPLMNHPKIDSIPELKAIGLLLYDYAAQELADNYGPFPYINYKENKQKHPYTFNTVRDIYVTIVNNLDTISACFDNYSNRPDWYKKELKSVLRHCDKVTSDYSIESWKRFANSLKLRMALKVNKVMPERAKKWAEEAVESGVIESTKNEIALSSMMIGFTNPLLEISETWSDTRLNASFESLLKSLNHPYMSYLFKKNGAALINEKDPTKVLEPNSRIVGLRAGIRMIPGQAYDNNMRTAYSKLEPGAIAQAPLYLMKMSEVDFLRAEGAIRGWNMQGTAKGFYERGIDNAYLEDRMMGSSNYSSKLAAYKSQVTATPFSYVDPMNDDYNIESVTKIGVAWNEGDDLETKLEKIITQKYIAYFPYSFGAWSELRRTGYPKLFPVLNTGDGDGSIKQGELISRLPFPSVDTEPAKQDIVTSGLSALGGPDQQGTKIWWDVNSSNF